MAPSGYLDIHGHFYLPPNNAEAKTGEDLKTAFRSVDFMVTDPVTWSADNTIDHNTNAGVDMQMLSYIPPSHSALRAANDYGNSLVKQYPSRFGFLAALPTDDVGACLDELDRVLHFDPKPDGFALTTVYNDIGLGDPRLDKLWSRFDELHAVVHIHPNAYALSTQGRPAALIEVAFDTCRTIVDMIFNLTFKHHPNIKFVLSHCGGALPVLSGRLALLGPEPWVPNPNEITREDIEKQLAGLYVDTAATASTGMGPAVKMVGPARVVYGSDCGVPCSTEHTMRRNMEDVVKMEAELDLPSGTVATNGWVLFPDAAVRAGKFGKATETPML